MSASDELIELRASLTRATRELNAAAERLEALERETGTATIITPRWRRRDSAVAAGASLATAMLLGLVILALPAKESEPPQAIVVTTSPPKTVEPVVPPPPPPEPVVVKTPDPVVTVEAPPPPPPPRVVRPVVAAKPAASDTPSEPLRAVHVRERHEASDVF